MDASSLSPDAVHSHPLWRGTVRLMHSPPRDAATNMALDHAMLAAAAESGETLLRLYSWEQPSVSFGRNQRCDGVYDSARCAAAGIPAVRRPTGGRALLHAREVTYAVAAPNAVAPTLRGGYEAINDLLLDALTALGVPATRATPAGRTVSPGLAPCFETPSAGELVVGTRKLVGSAQHREAGAFLQHGSILLDDDQAVLQSMALVPLPPVPPPATLRAFDVVEADAVTASIVRALRHAASGDIVVSDDSWLQDGHFHRALSHYRDPLWTWRR